MFASSIFVIPGSAGILPAISSSYSIPKVLNYLRHAFRGQVLIVAISNLHRRRRSTRTQTLGCVPTELSIRGDVPSFNAQLPFDLIDARIHAHQPAAHVFADIDVILPGRLLVKHRVEGCDAQYVRWRIAHQPADVLGDFPR